jgi:hypothetical protein
MTFLSGDCCHPANTGTVGNLVGSFEAIGGSLYSFRSHACAAPTHSTLHTVQPKSRDPYTLLDEFTWPNTINNGQINPFTVWKFIVYKCSGLSFLFRKYVERAADEAQVAENIFRIFSPLQHKHSVLEERTVLVVACVTLYTNSFSVWKLPRFTSLSCFFAKEPGTCS